MTKHLGSSLALSVFCVLGLATAHADEPYAPARRWLTQGYMRVAAPTLAKGAPTQAPGPLHWSAHSLAWPIAFQDGQHSMGNTMGEFQSYGDGPYYHGGCDLRVAARAPVTTPVAGRIEAGHYGYTNNPDGSSTKFWKPWPQDGSTTYFEVAVIAGDGTRFEFHHMDETALSDEVLGILKAGGGSVAAGAVLGNTIAWPDGVYHHTHYNIISADGIHHNPEYYSPLLDDHAAPEVSQVLAHFADDRVVDFGSGEFTEAPKDFVLATIDHQDGNVYDHPPSRVAIAFENGAQFAWDFTERLATADGRFPPIWDFFVESIASPDGRTLSTSGGYGEGVSVVRLPVPPGAHGTFKIDVADEAGNTTRYKGRIPESIALR